MPKNAVVGLKPDIENQQLLDLALSVLEPGGHIHLVSFVQVPTQEDELVRLEAVKRQLKTAADGLRGSEHEVTFDARVVSVGVGAELARIASSMKADLLVIGLVKRSRVGKALLGSDAQSALMNSTCPVLAVHLS